MSKNQAKSKAYHQQSQDNESAFAESGLARPQDAFHDVMLRSRQINFNFAPKGRSDTEKVKEWQPANYMTCSRRSFQCYGGDINSLRGVWIREAGQFNEFVQRILSEKEFALDMEGHQDHSMHGIVALIQVSTWNYGDFLIDPFQLRNEINTVFKDILEDDSILKVMHGAQNDLLWLQRDFDINLNAFIDTQIVFQDWQSSTNSSSVKNKPQLNNPIGLKALTALFHPELSMDNNQTLSEWRLRPGHGFTRNQEIYAVQDVHPLLRIFDQMRNEMTKEQLHKSFERSKTMLFKQFKIKNSNNEVSAISEAEIEAREELKKLKQLRSQGNFDVREIASSMLEANHSKFCDLIEWRQKFAKVVDERPSNVLPSTTLIRLCDMQNPTLQDVEGMCGVLTASVSPQLKIIRNVLTIEDYILQLRAHECHNCLKTGHGPAWACPFPRNNKNYKLWMNRPENIDAKKRQNERRKNNWESKTGGSVFKQK